MTVSTAAPADAWCVLCGRQVGPNAMIYDVQTDSVHCRDQRGCAERQADGGADPWERYAKAKGQTSVTIAGRPDRGPPVPYSHCLPGRYAPCPCCRGHGAHPTTEPEPGVSPPWLICMTCDGLGVLTGAVLEAHG